VHRGPLFALLERYLERFPEDRTRVERIRGFVLRHADCFERSCGAGHVTGSAWVVSRDRSHVLLLRHRKLGAWLQPGGHADGDPDPAAVARREAIEECGLESLALVEWWRDGSPSVLPFDVDVHTIPARGEEPAHLHLDLRFLFVADRGEPLRASGESEDLRWVEQDEIAALSVEPSLLRMARKAPALLARV